MPLWPGSLRKKDRAADPTAPRFRIVEEVSRNGRSTFNVEGRDRMPRRGYHWIATFKTAKDAREFISAIIGREVVLTRIEGYYGAREDKK